MYRVKFAAPGPNHGREDTFLPKSYDEKTACEVACALTVAGIAAIVIEPDG